MAAQFQYSRLAHQAQAVQSLAQVFENVAFQPALHSQANPIFKLTDDNPKVTDNLATLKANIEQVRLGEAASHRVLLDYLLCWDASALILYCIQHVVYYRSEGGGM